MRKYDNVNISNIDLSDKQVFKELFTTYFIPLCSFANIYLKDETLSEEVVQETFSKLWEKKDDLKINSSLKAYLYKSVLYTIYNYIRHKKVEQKYFQWYKEYFKDAEMRNTFEEESEMYNDIQKAIDSLPERCREVFIMHKIHRIKHKEIAEKLNIKPKTVESQLRKAKIMLQEKLRKYTFTVFFIYCLFFL